VVGLAEGQWGVVSRAQLRGVVAPAAIDAWVRLGRLHVVHRGVYAVGHRVLRTEGRWLAAVLASGEGAVLGHRSAAAHWGLLATSAELIDVTAPRSRAGAMRVSGFLCVRPRRLLSCQSGSRSPKWILRPRRAAVQL
jgi:hypothetical protein